MEEPFPTIPQNTRLPVIIHLLQNNLAVIVVRKNGKIAGIITNTDIGKIFEKTSKEI